MPSIISIKYYVLSIMGILLLYIIPVAYAQSPSALPASNLQPQNPASSLPASPAGGQLPASIPPTSPIYTDLIVNNMFHTFSCLMIGSSVISQPCLTYQSGIPMLSQVNLSGGALGATTSLIGMLYANPPIRTADYLASVGEGLGIVKPAHAQVFGSGAQVLNPIIKLWEVSRNISYIAMIIVFLIIGLMVLFRNRINPQTVITAQAALPGLVIGLILITFSYFLAALISDLAFVGTNIVGYYFATAQGKSPQNLVFYISDKNVLSLFTPFTKVVSSGNLAGVLDSIWDKLADLNTSRIDPFDLDPQKVLTYLAMFLVTQLVLPFGSLVPGVGQTIIVGSTLALTGLSIVNIASISLAFIAMVILIYAMFRLLLRLIHAFLTIIFLTISAPFQFLAAALPGRQGIATGWILNMLGNILIFPVVLAVLYFVAFILTPSNPINKDCVKPCAFDISQSNQIPDNNFGAAVYAQGTGQQTPLTDKAVFPLLGGFNLDFIYLLLAFGALVALPKIPDIVIQTVGRAGQAGQLLGQEIGGSVAQGRGYAGQFQQGIHGLVGQVGRITDEPGWLLEGDHWERVTTKSPHTALDTKLSGARPGLGTRIKGRFGL